MALSKLAAGIFAAIFALPGAAHAQTGPPLLLSGPVRPGSTGQDVRLLQQRLKALHFTPGPVNGRFGQQTRLALWAFEKANGLRVQDVTSRAVRAALAAPRVPKPLVKGAPARRVEIDLRRQLLTVWGKRGPVMITHVSTGRNRHYCDAGHCGFSRTPRGDFRVSRKIAGWRIAPLGGLYYPTYFNGGIAMHGSRSVPARPASHGCVRIPMSNAKRLFRLVPNGMRVYVR
ncbi:L,D-transpeptidase family protein [Actinocorallia lasiicapitis]